LLEREQLDPSGELQEDQVVVASLQPLELSYGAASRVKVNLDNNISYVYLFRANEDTADKVPQLLQLVLLAGGILQSGEQNTFQRRRELIRSNRDNVINNLQSIIASNNLNVYFLDESIDIEYCIHNAIDHKCAKLYLKRGDEYIEWKSGEPAHSFWDEMREKKGAGNPDPGEAVFHGSRNFELKKGRFLNMLTIRMRKYFPEIGDQVLQLCLGPESSIPSAGATGGAGR
jgi:hypothetical protein